jgi:DNA-binding MarR family transcriptional regulator
MARHWKLHMRLLMGVYWFDNALQARLKKKGFKSVTRTQSLILLNVAMGERRAALLATNLGVSRQAMSQMLASMKKRGLITIKADETDKRAQIVSFSEQSQDIRDAAMTILAKLERELERRIGMKHVDAMRKALDVDWGAPLLDD